MQIFEPELSDATCTNEDALYRRLWLHVVLRAVEEATGVNLLPNRRATKAQIRARARAWLSHDSPDLRAVCAMAGVNADKLLEKYRVREEGQCETKR